ncbi:MAG TPA: hypothetical protein VF469_15370 [Kofleriaceae bacterium]
MLARLLVISSLAASGCSSSDACHDNEVEVDYLGAGSRLGEVDCKPLPASCGAQASCASNACIRDMYALCQAPYIGVACSDTSPPTIISCNL